MAGAAAMLLAACARHAGGGASLDKPVRVGFQRSGVLLVAKARGGLEQALHGLAPGVRWVEFPSGPPLMEALGAGAIDLGVVGETPPIFAQAAGAPIVYVAAQPVGGGAAALLVPPRSHAATVADLRGRRVAFTKATSSHLFVIQALRRGGMTLADIQPVTLSPADAAGAFASGAIDAWATWDPYYALAQRNQGARAILTGDALPPTSTFFIAARPFARDHGAVLAATLSALVDQARWAEAHHGEVAGLIAAATGLPPDVAAATLRRGPFAVKPIDDAVIAQQQAAADIFQQIGAIPNAVDVRAAAWRGWRPA
jgi:aliphatic sulfonates family ABC transporter substrate-binding protein